MVRKTTTEVRFEEWCEDNGGKFELDDDTTMCHHPNGDTLIYEDGGFRYHTVGKGKIKGDIQLEDNEVNYGVRNPDEDHQFSFAEQIGSGRFRAFDIVFTDNGFEKKEQGEFHR